MVNEASFLSDPTQETPPPGKSLDKNGLAACGTATTPNVDSPLPKMDVMRVAREALEQGHPSGAIVSLEAMGDEGIHNPEYLLLYAQAFSALEQWEAAKAWAEKGIELYPNSGVLWLIYSQVLLQLGEWDEALDCVEQVLQSTLTPELHLDALMHRANMHWQAGQGEHALADYTAALSLDPDLAEAYAARGQIYFQLGRWEKALSDHNEAIRIQPDEAPHLCNRSQTLKSLQRYPEALSDLNLALARTPRSLDALMQRGHLYLDVGDTERALLDWSRVLRHDPFHVQALLQRGALHHKLEHWSEAIEDFSRVIETFPYLPRPYRFRSECYEALGKIPQAISDALQALRCCEEGMQDIPELEHRLYRMGYQGPYKFPLPEPPSRAELLAYMEQIPEAVCDQIKCHQEEARGLFAMGKFQDAVAFFTAAIELDPYLYDSYIGRARALAALGKTESALNNLEQALELCPQSDFALHQRALLRFDLGDLNGAVEDMRQAISIYPFGVDYHNQMGLFALILEDDELARASFERVHTLDPTDTSALLHLGAICLRERQYGQAIKWYDLLLEIAPQDLDALVGRGKAYSQMGMWDSALQDWDCALQIEAIEPEIYMLRSEAHLKTSRPWKALEDVHTVMELSEADSPVWKRSAQQYQAIMGRLPSATVPDLNWRFPNVERLLDALEEEHALSLVKALLLCFPHNALLWCLQARAHHALGHASEAADALEQALQLDPQHAETFYYMGCFAGEEGQHEKAAKYLLYALEVSQEQDREWSEHEAIFRLAQAYERMEQLELAQDTYEKATKLKPKHMFSWLRWAETLVSLHRLEDAQHAYDQTVMLAPDLAMTWYGRAACCLQRGDEPQAIEDLKQALARNPKYIEKAKQDLAFSGLSVSLSDIVGMV